MTDQNSPSHWDALASDLGATPPTEEAAPQPASPPPPPPIARPKPAQRSTQPSSGPAQAGNWDLIANELGVTPSPQPAAPVLETKAAAPAGTERNRRSSPGQRAPQRSPQKAPQRTTERADEKTPERAEDSPNFFDESFDFEEPFDLLESSEPPAAAATPGAESVESAESTETTDKRRAATARGVDTTATSNASPSAADAGDRPADLPRAMRKIWVCRPRRNFENRIKLRRPETRLTGLADRRPPGNAEAETAAIRKLLPAMAETSAGPEPAGPANLPEHDDAATTTRWMYSPMTNWNWARKARRKATSRRGWDSAAFPPGKKCSGC